LKRYTIEEYAKEKKVTRKTVHNWIKNNLVKTEILPSGRKLIIEEAKK
jgi:predicted site-specific integrase-resolvase